MKSPVQTPYEPERERQPESFFLEAVNAEMASEARERTARRLRRLWNGRRLLVRATLWGVVGTALVALLIPSRYTSTVRLMPPSPGGSGSLAAVLAGVGGQAGGGAAGLLENSLGLKNSSALFVGILNSDRVRDAVIDKFHLQKVYGVGYPEDARKVLAEATNVSADRQSGIITVSVSDLKPWRAAAMAQEYINELNYVVNHLTTSSAHRESVFLAERLEQVKGDLETAEKDFSRFASTNTAIDIPNQGKAMVSAAATLQGNLIGVESELEALRQVYTDGNVHVRAAQARVNELRRQLDKLGGKGTDEKSGAGELYPSIRQLSTLGVTYADLLRRVKVEEAVFKTLTQEYEMARVEEARDIPTVKVLDSPLVPERKSYPPRLAMALAGGFLSLSLAMVWLMVRGRWDEAEPADPRKVLAQDIYSTLRAYPLRASRSGLGLVRSITDRGWRCRLSGRSRREDEQ
ncbi:MAG TPA: Wzz/FepE/Etk N-terminal domain-containing protein [Terriglobia bacterium]|nr:Wzz/FepE/Etk N-terminal domain-containing protein [Terriglobia bacterium]